MKHKVLVGISIALLLAVCAPDKPSPLYLTILKPHDNDTVTRVNPVEGNAYPGSRVTIGLAQNSPDTTLIPDDTGRFAGTYTIPTNETNYYSVYITASFSGHSITETRTVYYIQQ